MACELRHSRERLKQWVQERGAKRRAKSAAERVQGSTARLELQVAKHCQELQRLEAEAARVQEALALAKTKVREAESEQETAQLSLAKDLQASLRAEKDLLEQLEEMEETIRTDAALCDRAEAQAEVSTFQLRNLRCQLKPLEAQLAREEDVLAAMSQELSAGHQRAAELAAEAAQARQRKERFSAVREPLVAYFAARAYQDWESQRADGLRRRLLLRRCLRHLALWRQAAPRLRAEVDAFRERRQRAQLRCYWSDWAALKDHWRRALRMLAWTFRHWSAFSAARPSRRWLLRSCWRTWRARRKSPDENTTPALEAVAWADRLAQRQSRQSLLSAFRGWHRFSWQAARGRIWLRQRWRRKGALAAQQALQHLRAVIEHRNARERYVLWLWRRLVASLGRGHPFHAWRRWVQGRQAARKRAEVRLTRGLQPLLALHICRTSWLQWHHLLELRISAWEKASLALQAWQGMARQRSKRHCLAILLAQTKLAKAARRVSASLHVSRIEQLIRSWYHHRCFRKSHRNLIFRINCRCLSAVLYAWFTTTQRRLRAVPATTRVRALAQQGHARRVVREWLLATTRQVVASRPAAPEKPVLDLKEELTLLQQRVSRLKDGHIPLHQEAVACRDELNMAEKAVEVAKLEEQKASLEFQAYTQCMERRRVEVEGNLCEALRRNCRLARQLVTAQEASAEREKRLEASAESAEVLRSQVQEAEGQYVAALATLCSEALRLREQLGEGPSTTSIPSRRSEWEQEV